MSRGVNATCKPTRLWAKTGEIKGLYNGLLRVNIRFQFPSLAAVDYPKNATGSKFDGLTDGMVLRPGSPCDNFQGYCDVFYKCRQVDAEGPLVRLKNLLFNTKTLLTIKQWVTNYWYAVLLMGMGFVIFMALFIKCFAAHTPSSNPKMPKNRDITKTLSRPMSTLRRKGQYVGSWVIGGSHGGLVRGHPHSMGGPPLPEPPPHNVAEYKMPQKGYISTGKDKKPRHHQQVPGGQAAPVSRSGAQSRSAAPSGGHPRSSAQIGSGGVQSRPGPPPVGVPSSSQGGRGAPPAYSIPQGGPGHGYGEGRGHYNRNRGEAHAVGAAGGSRGARSASSSSANNRGSRIEMKNMGR